MNLNKKIFIPLGNVFFKYRDIVFTAIYAIPLLVSPPEDYERGVISARTMLGIALAAIGQIYRVLVIGYRYIKRGGKDKKIYADHLVKDGFFAHSRNPLYFGNIMIIAGLSIMYGTEIAYFLVMPFFAVGYYSLIVAEENYLSSKFGKEYKDYAGSVNRFIPNLKGIRKSLQGFRFDWGRAIRKDYGNIFFVCLGILTIITYSKMSMYGAKALKDGLVVFFALLFLYLLARFLKKKDYLSSPKVI